MRFQAIHPAEVRRWWSFVRPLIEQVFRICREHQIPEDVYACLIANKAVLHVLFVDEEPKGCVVTEACGDPDHRFLNVWILHFVQNVDAHREEIVKWLDSQAALAQVKRIRFQSPRAWKALIRDEFKEKSVIYERIIQ